MLKASTLVVSHYRFDPGHRISLTEQHLCKISTFDMLEILLRVKTLGIDFDDESEDYVTYKL